LSILNGKRGGYFLEIGAQDPIIISNAYLLESKFGWKGISIDLDSSVVLKHKEYRTNVFINDNALKINYEDLLKSNQMPERIDYLQVDIDPAEQSLAVLKIFPFEKYKFSVITFEHDVYRGGNNLQVKEESRYIFQSYGYTMVAGNICNRGAHDPYEDWWVDLEAVDLKLVEKFRQRGDLFISGGEYLGIWNSSN